MKKSGRTQFIAVWEDPKIVDKIDVLARKEELDRSACVRQLLRRSLQLLEASA